MRATTSGTSRRATASWRSSGDVDRGRGVRRRRARPSAAGPAGAWRRRSMLGPPAPATPRRRRRHARTRCRRRSGPATSASRRKSDDFTAAGPGDARSSAGKARNRLQQVLRTRRGLAYGASADLNAYRLCGRHRARKPRRARRRPAEALRVIVDEFFRLQREQVGVRELDGAKAFLDGQLSRWASRRRTTSPRKVLTALFYGLPLTELETFRERVNAVTPDDIQRVDPRASPARPALDRARGLRAAFIMSQLERVGYPGAREVVAAGRSRRDRGGPAAPVRRAGAERCRWCSAAQGVSREAVGAGEGRGRPGGGRRGRPRRASRR
ncbi:MAG: insulinase family protein [Ignavibacteriales bacterium]|nr:insulinase family protein [Ignavibacteriales bacterium]